MMPINLCISPDVAGTGYAYPLADPDYPERVYTNLFDGITDDPNKIWCANRVDFNTAYFQYVFDNEVFIDHLNIYQDPDSYCNKVDIYYTKDGRLWLPYIENKDVGFNFSIYTGEGIVCKGIKVMGSQFTTIPASGWKVREFEIMGRPEAPIKIFSSNNLEYLFEQLACRIYKAHLND